MPNSFQFPLHRDGFCNLEFKSRYLRAVASFQVPLHRDGFCKCLAIARLLIAAGLLLAALPAAAQDQKVEYARDTVINFEDDTIQGDLTRPDGEHVDARQRVRHTNLIKVREDFREEVLESVGEL